MFCVSRYPVVSVRDLRIQFFEVEVLHYNGWDLGQLIDGQPPAESPAKRAKHLRHRKHVVDEKHDQHSSIHVQLGEVAEHRSERLDLVAR